MQLQSTLITLLFLSVRAAAQDANAPAEANDPVASFARMMPGEWRVKLKSGMSQFVTWHWGPGEHSLRVMTHGSDGEGRPWRELEVLYWHPSRKQLFALSLNSYERSVAEGTVHVEEESWESTLDLHQTGAHRRIVRRSNLEGPNELRTKLLEQRSDAGLDRLVELDYIRSETLTPIEPRIGDDAKKPTEHFKAFESLLGQVWETREESRSDGDAAGTSKLQTTFEWIPYADAIYARTVELRGGESVHRLDAYFFHHTGTGALRCLALSNGGGVYEGDVSVLDGGSLSLDLKGYEGDRVLRYLARFDFDPGGALRQSVWSLEGSDRRSFFDMHHPKLEPIADSTLALGDVVSGMDKGLWIVFQDKADNYWFGSDGQGVYRYDGKTTIQFTTKHGLCDNRIREIKGDDSGNVYITSQDGINKFDGKRLTTLTVTKSGDSAKAWKLQPGDLWFKGRSGENGPYRYDGESLFHLEFPKHFLDDNFYERYSTPPYSPYEVYSIYKDRHGNVWFGTSNFGLCRYDGVSLCWMYEGHLTAIEGGGSFGIRSIIEDKDGAFWICNTRHRYRVSPNQTPVSGIDLLDYEREKGIDASKLQNEEDPLYFMSAVKDDRGDLWMSTYGAGVWRYDGENMTHYPVHDGSKIVTLFAIYEDNHGGLWLGSHEYGAWKFNGKTFERLKP